MFRAILARTFRSISANCTPRARAITAYTRESSSTAASTEKGKLYELRTYAIQPAKFGEFLKLSAEHFHLRTAHSKLIGYWTTELGGLNEVVHLWEYGR